MGCHLVEKQRIIREYDHFWDQVSDSSDDWTIAGPWSLRMLALRTVPANGGRTLDLGCGNGRAMSVLRARGRAVIGCDISLRALGDARNYGEVIKADGTRLPFRSNAFQCILLLDALEHVVEKDYLMRECWRVLSSDGIAVLTTPLPRATSGHGDLRQPYDRPVTYREILSMIEGLFRIQYAKGVLKLGGLGGIWRALPSGLYMNLPVLLGWATEVMLTLGKIPLTGRSSED